jgi:hypothetical protein
MTETTARRRWKLFAVLAVALAALLGLAACGGAAEGSEIASAGSASAEPDPSETPEEEEEEEVDPDEAALEFAECMRDHGVDIPDPEPGESGGFRAFGGPDNDVDEQTMQEAMDACRDLMPQFDGPAEFDPEMEERLLAMTECMREHGIDMPDPTSNGGGIRLDLGDNPDIDEDELRAAAEECREIAGMPEPREAGGPTP